MSTSLEVCKTISASTASPRLKIPRMNAEFSAAFTRSTGKTASSTVEKNGLSTLMSAKQLSNGKALTGGDVGCVEKG